MNTNTDNPSVTITKLKRELKYWRTLAVRYQVQIEAQSAMSEKLEICMNDVEHLKKMLSEKVAQPTVQEKIEMAIAKVYPHFLPSMVSCRSRKGEIVELRHIWMQLMYKFSGISLCKIGSICGRDHSTILHAINKVDAMCLYEKRFRANYTKVLNILIENLHSKEN